MGAYNTNDKAKDTAREVLGGPTQPSHKQQTCRIFDVRSTCGSLRDLQAFFWL